jgi:succinate-semialdehyde dehydrogenase / glutarate-semialdehyde dehydrogenase
MALLSLNPATGAVIRRYPAHRRHEITAALAQVHQAQTAWRELAPASRARHLGRLGRQLRQQRDPLAALITEEMGKPIEEARREVEKCAAACAYYAKHGPAFLQPERPVAAPAGAFVVAEPLGVVLAIMPWNFPFWQAFRAIAPALMAGNTVLLKHASNVCGCALAIEAVVREAGLPAGVLRVILASSDAIAPLIADPRVRAVTLTGSTEAGRKVAAVAGAALKPCVFELGGADSYLVLEDADLDHAARTLAAGRLLNGGQSCIAAKRLIVVQAVAAAFEERLAAAFRARRSGDPTDAHTDLGPLAREDLRAELHRQVSRSVRAGARLVLGGRVPRGPGFFYPPTILADVKPGMPAYAEELFGPVASLIKVRDEAEGVRVANDTPYGLGAGVFTRDRARGRDLAVTQLDAGLVFVNDFVRSDPSLPFGGTKASGYGRELGRAGLLSLVNLKTVLVHQPKRAR